ncbi:MAG: LLM class flavin-dependent oxidoreductase [Alphaproteobacteria bacterium]|nr:LLM class flavin-dependent oxidoreductase [Alphaproteobacteria bacterium]
MKLSVFTVMDHHPAMTRTLPELYAQTMREAELADALGYDTFYVAEHHFHEYGVVPDPAPFLAAIAQRTRRIRLGPAIAALVFRHPLAVAESYAMLDQLSGGRAVLGVGSGYLKHEFEGFAIDPATKRERFDSGLAALKKALAGGVINVPAFADRRIPIQVAVLRKEAAYHVGARGDDLMCVPYASVDRFDEVGEMVEAFRRGRADANMPAGPESSVWAFHTYVAETDDKTRADASECFDRYVASRLYAKRQTYDDILASGLGLLGGIETVASKIAMLSAMGVGHVMTLTSFGGLAEDKVRQSMTMMFEKVLPRAAEIARKVAAR